MPISGCDSVWSQDICTDIDTAIMTVVGQIRRAQTVFQPILLTDSQTSVPADLLATSAPHVLSIEEGKTRPLIELSTEFTLTQSQADNEASLHTGKTLALLAAKALALGEDALLFEGEGAQVPPSIKVSNKDSAGDGLLGAALETIEVSRSAEAGYPESIFTAVVDGIAKLVSKGQPGPYALFLASSVFADTYAPLPTTLVTTADRIIPLVPGGFCSVAILSDPRRIDERAVPAGLLVSLGGNPTSIYVGADTTLEYTQRDQQGRLFFRLFERIQFVAREREALVKFRFTGSGRRGE